MTTVGVWETARRQCQLRLGPAFHSPFSACRTSPGLFWPMGPCRQPIGEGEIRKNIIEADYRGLHGVHAGSSSFTRPRFPFACGLLPAIKGMASFGTGAAKPVH